MADVTLVVEQPTMSGSTIVFDASEVSSSSSGNFGGDHETANVIEKIPTEIQTVVVPDLESASEKAPVDAEQTAQDPNEVDWDGPNDPLRPLNWHIWRKAGIIVVLSVFRLLM